MPVVSTGPAAWAAISVLRALPRRVLLPPCSSISRYSIISPPVAPAFVRPFRPGIDVKEAEEEKEVCPKAPLKPPVRKDWADHPDFRRWKEKEREILADVEPTILLAKDIIHSSRYADGECLNDEDQKIIVQKLLAYHPHAEDKIGCGLDFIMVDRHPQFRNSRCLFVVRTDGGWIDFSYQKCLRAYISRKYPSDADRFIREHFKRT